MAEHDSAKAYELVGILLLWRLRFISHKKKQWYIQRRRDNSPPQIETSEPDEKGTN